MDYIVTPPTSPTRCEVNTGDRKRARLEEQEAIDRDLADYMIPIRFKHLRNGSAIITTPRGQQLIEGFTGSALILPQERIVDEDAEDENVGNELNVFNIAKVHIVTTGNKKTTKWVPCIKYKVAAGMGYSHPKELIDKVIAPIWASFGLTIEHEGNTVIPKVSLTYSWSEKHSQFKIRGSTDPAATLDVHPHIVDWKDFGLVFSEPCWKAKVLPYDPTKLMKILRELPCVVLNKASNSDTLE